MALTMLAPPALCTAITLEVAVKARRVHVKTRNYPPIAHRRCAPVTMKEVVNIENATGWGAGGVTPRARPSHFSSRPPWKVGAIERPGRVPHIRWRAAFIVVDARQGCPP